MATRVGVHGLARPRLEGVPFGCGVRSWCDVPLQVRCPLKPNTNRIRIRVMTTTPKHTDSSTWRKRPAQMRSRQAEASLTRAARELLSERSYAEVRVDDVAKRAGVSVGGFYARFRGKSALLHLSDIDFLEDCRSAFDQAVPDAFVGGLPELFDRFVGVMVDKFEEHRPSIQQAWRHTDPEDEEAFAERAMAFNAHVHGRLRRLIDERTGSIGHEAPALARNMAIFFASSAARDAVISGFTLRLPRQSGSRRVGG